MKKSVANIFAETNQEHIVNILKAVLKNEVFPALGCTEPIAVAYAASIAANQISGVLKKIAITVDPGIFKNGFAVTVPNTHGEKGNLIAGILGALIKNPDLKMELLLAVTDEMVIQAKSLIRSGNASITFDKTKTELYIEVVIQTENETSRAIIKNSHTHLALLEKNNLLVFENNPLEPTSKDKDYKAILKTMKISDFFYLIQNIDDEDYVYIKRGISMNLEISEKGQKLRKVGHYVADLMEKGFFKDDIFSTSKVLTASAADARMAGLGYPVMSSGGSGNQGIVAILVPYNVGKHFNIDEQTIIHSIALSHLVNSYVKCFTGNLSPLCGCAIAAGVGAAVAIVYQQHENDMKKITLAVNNLISDLGGMLCDGAKGGCALKVASSADSAIRSAYMALNDYGITEKEGFVGKTAEETIKNLSAIGKEGMANVDETVLGIMMDKLL